MAHTAIYNTLQAAKGQYFIRAKEEQQDNNVQRIVIEDRRGGCSDFWFWAWLCSNSGGGGGCDDRAMAFMAGVALAVSAAVSAYFTVSSGAECAENIRGIHELDRAPRGEGETLADVNKARQIRQIMAQERGFACAGQAAITVGLTFLSIAAVVYALWAKRGMYTLAKVEHYARLGSYAVAGGTMLWGSTELIYHCSPTWGRSKIEELAKPLAEKYPKPAQ